MPANRRCASACSCASSARELLIYSDRSVIDVAVQAGFSSTSHFATWYKRIYGARPSEMRGGAAGHRRNRA
jgi:transcriptional regulator GlxA family with amidase domain